jgi:hypothetical protein
MFFCKVLETERDADMMVKHVKKYQKFNRQMWIQTLNHWYETLLSSIATLGR